MMENRIHRRKFMKYLAATADTLELAGSSNWVFRRQASGGLERSTTSTTTPPTPVTRTSVFEDSAIFGVPSQTDLLEPGEIDIEGVGAFQFLPADVETTRKDIFAENHFQDSRSVSFGP